MPFFFWLFLIMAGTWYLFVFRVLCCDECCENSDVALVHKCCDNVKRNSDIEEGQFEENKCTISVPPYEYIIVSG